MNYTLGLEEFPTVAYISEMALNTLLPFCTIQRVSLSIHDDKVRTSETLRCSTPCSTKFSQDLIFFNVGTNNPIISLVGKFHFLINKWYSYMFYSCLKIHVFIFTISKLFV